MRLRRATGTLFLVGVSCGPRASALEQATADLDRAQVQGPPAPQSPTDDPSPPSATDGPAKVDKAVDDSALPPVDKHTTREIGQPDELLVLWPRIVPRNSVDRSVAKKAQAHMAALARVTLPDRAIDVRPEPQRSCPPSGCNATTIGMLLTGDDTGCVAVATVTPRGLSETTLLPWGGDVLVKDIKIPFGEPPEAQVQVQSSTRCDDLLDDMKSRDEAIAKALHAATRNSAP